MAIVLWTSEGMDWTSLKSKQLYPYIEALRLALVERADAVITSSESDKITHAPLRVPIVSGRLIDSNFGDAFTATLKRLMTLYAIPDDYNGDRFINRRNIADYEAIIGSTLVENVDSKPFTEEWALQRYNILNLMTMGILGTESLSGNESLGEQRQGNDAAIIDRDLAIFVRTNEHRIAEGID